MYPIDRRHVASHVYSLLQSLRKTAILLQVSHSTISRWLKTPQRKLYFRNCPKRSHSVIETVRFALQNDPFLDCCRLRDIVRSCTGVSVSRSLIHTAIKKAGMTRKKARMCGAPITLQAKVVEFVRRRDAYLEEGRPFVSIDETSFGRNVKSPYGYAKKGSKLFVKKNTARITTTSVVACVSTSGWLKTQSFVGSVNTDRYLEFLQQVEFAQGAIAQDPRQARTFMSPKWREQQKRIGKAGTMVLTADAELGMRFYHPREFHFVACVSAAP